MGVGGVLGGWGVSLTVEVLLNLVNRKDDVSEREEAGVRRRFLGGGDRAADDADDATAATTTTNTTNTNTTNTNTNTNTTTTTNTTNTTNTNTNTTTNTTTTTISHERPRGP